MKMRLIVIGAVMATALSGCSGPRSALEIGSKDVPVDIVLGRQPSPRALPPGSSPNVGFPGFIQPPPPRFEPGAPPSPDPPAPPCAPTNPHGAAELVARFEAPPPVPATYGYRNRGSIALGGGIPVPYPPSMTRTVRNVRTLDADDNFEFDIDIVLAGATTTTTYRVLNSGLAPDRGIYIAQTVSRAPGKSPETFTPDTPLLLLPFPASEQGTNLENEVDGLRRQRYQSSGTDALTQTTMVLEVKFNGKTFVNACGKNVDVFEVEVTNGRIVGPTKNIDLTGSKYWIATQYGALIVQDDVRLAGTERQPDQFPITIDSKNLSTINVVPKEPA